MDLYLRKVIHPLAIDNYRVLLKDDGLEVEIGSIGIQHDEIAIGQLCHAIEGEEFQSWKLVVTNSTATLSCDDGNGNVVYSKHIEFTDFPLPEIELWVEGNVILLPSEH